MSDNSKLDLPGDFQPGKLGFVRHSLLKSWREKLTADRIIPGPGLSESQTPQGRILSASAAGIAAAQGWLTSLSFTAPDYYWQVSSTKSTVRDGINGPLIDLTTGGAAWKSGGIQFDVPTLITADSYISLKAAVDPTTLALSDWELVAEASEPVEVEFDLSSPYGQIFMRLRIAKIVFAGSPLTPTVTDQYATAPQGIDRLFLNGKLAKGISSI